MAGLVAATQLSDCLVVGATGVLREDEALERISHRRMSFLLRTNTPGGNGWPDVGHRANLVTSLVRRSVNSGPAQLAVHRFLDTDFATVIVMPQPPSNRAKRRL
jgi:hypothetical protein